MPNTATRLINLIMLLQRQPNQKAANLAAELGGFGAYLAPLFCHAG
jgi:hypothetical protein